MASNKSKLKYIHPENFRKDQGGDVTLITFEGDRAKNYLKNLQFNCVICDESFSDFVVLVNEIYNREDSIDYVIMMHYKSASVSVLGTKDYDIYKARTKIVGRKDKIIQLESKLIEMTGDNLTE